MAQNCWVMETRDRIRSAAGLIAMLLGRACQLNAGIEWPTLTKSVTGTDAIQDCTLERKRGAFEIDMQILYFANYHMHISNHLLHKYP